MNIFKLNVMVFLATLSVDTALLADDKIKLQCTTGPIKKKFGDNHWKVYSCNDNKSVIIVSIPGSSAHPFYFLFYAKKDTYQLHGEGTGSRHASGAAYKEIRHFKSKEIRKLVRETKNMTKTP